MTTWDNTTTGHNRTISTGPTPDGTVRDLKITVGYVADSQGVTDKAVALDNHIIPLIMRVPEMREALRQLGDWLRAYEDDMVGTMYDDSRSWLRKIDRLTGPTPQELYIQTGSYD